MKHSRSWLSLLTFCTLTVLAAALVFAIIIAGASVALASHQQSGASQESRNDLSSSGTQDPGAKFSGMITDSHCGARHMRNSHQSSAECARACFRKGAIYVLVDGAQRYTLIGGEDTLVKLVGERANVIGTRQGDTILVDSAAPIF